MTSPCISPELVIVNTVAEVVVAYPIALLSPLITQAGAAVYVESKVTVHEVTAPPPPIVSLPFASEPVIDGDVPQDDGAGESPEVRSFDDPSV